MIARPAVTADMGWGSRWLARAALLLLAGAMTMPPARAQDIDPPARVGRVSDVEGQVWVYSPDAGDWIGAVRNQPIAAGDRVTTEAGARAELQIGSTTLRLDANAELDVTRLDDTQVALTLRDGSCWVRVRDMAGAGRLEIATDEGRFTPLRDGSYRIDRRGGRSDLTVLAGQGRYEGSNSALVVEPGQRAQFFVDAAGAAQYSLLAPAADVFAAWSSDRDRRQLGSVTAQYVSPEMTGAADLDAYGRWEQDAEYGPVWVPTAVGPDWAPYSVGTWTYARPWGWTWVDAAPWGYAPFHYGRWLYARGRWGWTPGARVARPVWAPALVAWVGSPGRGGPSPSGGGSPVGWVPLGPREVYVPGYRVSHGYARNLNGPSVGNPALIDRVFANPQAPREFGNRGAPRGLTVVPSEVLAGRRPVGPAAAQWRQTPWARDVASQRGSIVAELAPPVPAPRGPVRGNDSRPPTASIGTNGRPGTDLRPAAGRSGERFDGQPGADGRLGGGERVGERVGIDARPGFDGRAREDVRPALQGRPGLGTRPAFDERRDTGGRPFIDGTPPAVERRGAVVEPRAGDRSAPSNAAGDPSPGFVPGERPGRNAGDRRPLGQAPGPGMPAAVAPPTLPARGIGAAPAVPPAPAPPLVQRPAIGTAATEPGPMMRAFPVRREGEDRRAEPPRAEERRERAPNAVERAPLQIERPPAPRPVEAPRAVEAPAAARTVEAPRPAPVQPAAPPQSRAEPHAGREERRNEPGASQR